MLLSEIQWGDDSAEKDPNLLHYFITSGALPRLLGKTKNLVIGRKGSGKSALRRKLESEFSKQENTHVINISPKYNSIRSILNDKDIVQTYGVEIFFHYSWLRQILTDCLCTVGSQAKGKYCAESLEFARQLSLQLKMTSKDLVENISEILTRIKGKAGSLGEFGLNIDRELRDLADANSLEYHFNNICKDGAKFVIVIDDLDLGWDNSSTANNLLLGLLSASNYISALSPNIYPCIFLREDVYSILITQTQHSDKYRNIERIRWDREGLLNMLNERINFNRAKNSMPILADSFHTVFPVTIGTSNTDNWLLERTLSRPRELIQFARYYTESVNNEIPSDQCLKDAESTYSSWKLDDLCAEFSNQYPALNQIFAYWKTKFFRHKYHLDNSEITTMLLNIIVDVPINEPWFNEIATAANTDSLIHILYKIGFIGDFVQGGDGGNRIFYSHIDRHEPRFEQVQIHPCFRKAVNTVDRIRNRRLESQGGDSQEIDPQEVES